MYLGFSTWAMPALPIDPVVTHLAKVGFDAIEICVLPNFSTALDKLDAAERRRIPHLLRAHNLKLSAVNAYVDLMEPDETKFADNAAYVQRAADLAAEWIQDGRQPVVVSGFGGRQGELTTRQGQLVERISKLGDYAQARGVVLALEHHVGNAVETPDQVVSIMQQVTSLGARINFDISHFNVVGIPIEESVDKIIPYAVHTHIKDEAGRAPNHQYLIPGEGVFDYIRYLKAMQAHGYTGAISTEISVMVQRRPNYDALATATRSYEVVSQAFVDAGIERQ